MKALCLDLVHTVYVYFFFFGSKFLTSLPNSRLWAVVEADFIDITDSEVKVHLLLTSDLLIVINLEDDCQQQAFSLREVEICSKITSPQILTILWKDSMQPPSSDQVAQM